MGSRWNSTLLLILSCGSLSAAEVLTNPSAECVDPDAAYVTVTVLLADGCTVSDGPELELRATIRDGNTVSVKPWESDVTRFPGEPDEVLADFQRSKIPLDDLAFLELAIIEGGVSCGGNTVPLPLAAKPVGSAEQAQALLSSCGLAANREGRPLRYSVALAKGDDDETGDPGLAVDFTIEKVWGYQQRYSDSADRLKRNELTLKVEGDGVTNDGPYSDTAEAKLGYRFARFRFPDGDNVSLLPSVWLGADFGPETTFDTDSRDYVFGLQADLLVNFHPFHTSNVFGGPHPHLSFGVERVDPEKREDGTDPENYERAWGKLKWKLYFGEQGALDLSYEVVHILDDDDAMAAGIDRWQRKFEGTVLLFRDNEFQPLLKYSRGETKPLFEFYEEVLVGVKWTSGTQ